MPEIDVDMTHDFVSSMLNWWPPLSKSDIPLPETHIIEVTKTEEGRPDIDAAISDVARAFEALSTEKAFIRSDKKSASFINEGSTLFSTNPDHIEDVLECLVMSHVIGAMKLSGLAVREWLPVDSYGESYGRLIAPEVRVYLEDGDIQCYHNRVTEDDLSSSFDSTATLRDIEEVIESEWETIQTYADAVGEIEPFNTSGWVIDFLRTTDGEWYLTDAAIYGLYYSDDREKWKTTAYHPSGCEYNLEENPPTELPADPEFSREHFGKKIDFSEF